MSTQFKYLFTPIEIGPITVRNRVYTPPLHAAYAENGYPVEEYAYYHAEKAKGGIGLTIIESSNVHPSSEYFPLTPRVITLWDEKVVPGLKKIADMVHEYGAKILCQLWHTGHIGNTALNYLPIVSASPIADVSTRLIPKELEVEEIDEVVDAFGKAAKHVVAAGLDGVELHGTHGYLIEQFYSPLWNRRTDKYGGPLENRMRFVLEIIDRIREYVGYDTVLAVRMSADELIKGGITPEDGKAMARMLEGTGKVDFLDVDGTTYHHIHICVAPMYVPPGHLIYTAAAVKEAVKKIPVGGVGRITDPVMAERFLAEGKVDMVGMGRQHLADPETVNKARAGKLDDIRPCVGCCQNCIGRLFVGLPVNCVVNPVISREKEWGIGTIKPAKMKKKVMVVGGGPAGLEAARVVALRGYNVTLYEKEKELGGQVNLAAKIPGRDELNGLTRWLKLQVEKLGVKVVLGKEVTPETVEAEKPDAVIIATGSTPIRTGMQGFTMLPIPGHEGKNVVTGQDILRGTVRAGKNVVILDEDGGIEPLGVAEILAAEGRNVEVLTRSTFVGTDLVAPLTLPHVYTRVMRLGVKMTPNTFIKEISGNTVVTYNIYTEEERRIKGVDTAVLITGKEANDKLYRQLKGKVKELYRAGDCVTPRKLDHATYEGHKVGRMV